MKIVVITPAPPRTSSGNRTTALRLASILRAVGHDVQVAQTWDGHPRDAMIALHAWRSAESIAAFRARLPQRPLIVVLSGTDVYEFVHTHPETTLGSMMLADVLVGLHDRIADDLPLALRPKVRVIRQAAARGAPSTPAADDRFHVLVVAHLRDVKDPLRTAYAVRDLEVDSRIHVRHLGAALTPQWRDRARAETATNPRYEWLRSVPLDEVRTHLARSRVLVVSSRAEGGANVISEAVMAGTPVIATRISGNVGLLGPAYPGLFPVGDTRALRSMLRRAEADAAFLDDLDRHRRELMPTFERSVETHAWRSLLEEVESL